MVCSSMQFKQQRNTNQTAALLKHGQWYFINCLIQNLKTIFLSLLFQANNLQYTVSENAMKISSFLPAKAHLFEICFVSKHT